MIYRFEKFELDPTRRKLLRDGEMVSLNPKAFDLLLTLVQNHGQVLSKNALLVEPAFESLQPQPRFQGLLRRMGLESLN